MKKRFKTLIPLVLVFMILFSTLSTASPISVYINDGKLSMSVPPVSEQGRTLVPLRAIFESIGASVDWNQSTRTATGVKDGKEIVLQLGNKFATINGANVELDVAAKVINGSTLVPTRFVAESLGAKVDWDGNTRSVLIDSKYPHGKYKVNRVVDGDTIKIDFNGKEESLRLIGVDTPESVHSDASKNVPEGKVASDYAKSMLEGKEVAIEFDVQERDQYGRLLGYVWINGQMFNKTLMSEGYAKVATYAPNVRYVDDFTKLQGQARGNKKGFWRGGEFGQPAPQTSENLVIAVSGQKYHKSNCRTVKQIQQYVTAEQAKSMGYEACKVCKP